jgi:hypothetical protein
MRSGSSERLTIGCVLVCGALLASCVSAPPPCSQPPLTCPPPARVHEMTTADGRELYCADARGQREGAALYFSADRTLLASAWFDRGERGGTWIWFHSNGRVSNVATYKRGRLDGELRQYDDAGALRLASTYVAGRMNGQVTKYFEDGSRHANGEMRDNRKSGRWIYWHPDGSVAREMNYDRGRVVGDSAVASDGRR